MAGVREELAAGIAVEATSILPSLNVKTDRSWRGIVPFTHPSREGRMTVTIRRRELLVALGGAAAAWPLAARAQRGERLRRIGVLLPATSDDAQYQAWFGAFLQALGQSGWTIGRNVQVDTRWATANADSVRRHATELAALAPDVIVSPGASTVGPLLQVTRTIPIVFAIVADPVGAGFVASLARPGGNATGFTTFEYGTSGKWLELLKEIAPGMRRVAVLRDAATPSGVALFGVIQAVASALRVEANPLDLRDAAEIERAVTAFADYSSNSGLVITPHASSIIHRDLIVQLAARHRLPAVYFDRPFVAAGGLVSYGPDMNDQFRRAAGYVDRILKGEKPADLPVQAPTKYELVINLKTAKAMGLEIPATVLARADEVIE
jgi:putative tryptophan/tyrosine transport system substrate-binding protein